MSTDGIIWLSQDEAKQHVREQAHETGEVDPEGENPRRIVHCFLGNLGADWDEPAVLDIIDQAITFKETVQVGFVPSPFGLVLAVVAPKEPGSNITRQFVFDTIKHPSELK